MKILAYIYIKYIRNIISFLFNSYYYIRMIISNNYFILKKIREYIYKDIERNGWSAVIEHSAKTEYVFDGFLGFPDWTGWGLVPYYRKILLSKKLKHPTETEYVGDCDDVYVIKKYLEIYLKSKNVLDEHKNNKIELYSIISNNLLDLPKFHVILLFYKNEDRIYVFSNGQLVNIFKSKNDVLWYYQSMYKYKGKTYLVRLG